MAQYPPPRYVATTFVHQYYNMLHNSPELAHKYYGETSMLGRPEEDGTSSITTTLQAINDKILSLSYGQFRIRTLDVQESLSGAVLLVVTGTLTDKDSNIHDFSQTFFLARQDSGYFVLNDVFSYILPREDVDVPVTRDEVVPAPAAEEVEKVEEVPTPEDEVPVAEEVQKADDVEVPVAEEVAKAEDVPKRTYASLFLKSLKESGATLKPQPPRKPAVTKKDEKVAPGSDLAVNKGAEEYKIYIKGLPMNATESMVEDEFKKFGAIKKNGIQVRSNNGFCFGFVDFEMPSAVQKAIQASPVRVGERQVFVEEKRSTNSSSRPRFQPGNRTSSSNHQNLSKPSYSNRGTSSSGNLYLSEASSNRGTSSSGHQNLNKPSSPYRGTSSGDNGRSGSAGGSANGRPRNTPPRLSTTAPTTTKLVYRKKTTN